MPTPILAAREPQVVTDFRLNNRSERAVGANGELNASTNKDLLQNSLALMAAASSGQVMTESDATQREKQRAENIQLMAAAMTDPEVHRILGERMAENIYVTANRKGYLRTFLPKITLKQGELPRFPVRQKNVQAVMVTGPTKVQTQIALDRYVMPPELEIATRLIVPQRELNQGLGDTLEEKYTEGLEAVMVTEDRMLYNAMNAVIGIDNDRQIFSGTINPQSLMSVRQQVERWGLKSTSCLMANDLFQDIVGDSNFVQALELIAKHELIMTGRIATLYGLTLISEAYRHPEHKVLSEGEFYVLADPSQLGGYADRNGVNSQPIDGTTEGIIGKGWLIWESLATAIATSRGVAAGLRM